MKRPKRSEILFYLSILKEEMQEYGLEIEGLFGSFAQGEEGVYSDIDIAVRKIPAFRERFSAYDYFSALETLKNRVRKRFHRPVDVLDLGGESPFNRQIEKEMIRV